MTIQSGIKSLFDLLQKFEQPGLFLIICAVAFLCIILFGKRKGRTAFVYPLILFAIVIWNPYVFTRVLALHPEIADTAELSFWCIPFAMIAVYGLFSLCRRMKKVWAKILAVAVFGVSLVVAGVPAVTEASYYDVGTDRFEGKNEGSAIADLITQNLSGDTADIYLESEDLAAQIRTENAALFCNVAASGKTLAKETLEENAADFYVVPTGEASDKVLSEECVLIGKSSRYSVYANK